MTRARLLACAAVLCGLVACEHDEEPFEGQWWAVSCSTSPYPLRAYFPADERLDETGRRRTYVGNVIVDLDTAGLADAYVWEVDVHRGPDSAETTAFERAPFPVDFEAAYDLEPLRFEAATFVDSGTSATIQGTCDWGGRVGDLFVTQTDDCDACIDCSHVAGVAAGGPFAVLISAFATRWRRRTAARQRGAFRIPGN